MYTVLKRCTLAGLKSLAMGSPETYGEAEKEVAAAAKKGGWVMLKNVHLACDWLNSLEKQVLIPSLCTHFARAGIEWRRCHHAVCMTRPYKEPHHSGQAEP